MHGRPDPNRPEGRAIEHSTIAAPAVLQVDGLCFCYPQRALFSHWSARIPPGLSLVRGGDGSGKTTLLRLLAGELPSDAGELQINGISLRDRAAVYRQQVFWVEPRSVAFDQITALDYFNLVQRAYPGLDEPLLGDLTEGLSLAPHLEKPLYMLSTGSKRKVWLAAAFASGAAVTLLDEPFAGLDKASIAFVLELLEDAGAHPARAWIVAHHEAPGELALSQIIELGD